MSEKMVERGIVSAILVDPQLMASIFPFIRHEDFEDRYFGTIYEAMASLMDDHLPVGVMTIADRVVRDYEFFDRADRDAFMARLVGLVPPEQEEG